MLPQGRGVSKAKSYHGWGTKYASFWCCYGTGVNLLSVLKFLLQNGIHTLSFAIASMLISLDLRGLLSHIIVFLIEQFTLFIPQLCYECSPANRFCISLALHPFDKCFFLMLLQESNHSQSQEIPYILKTKEKFPVFTSSSIYQAHLIGNLDKLCSIKKFIPLVPGILTFECH